MAFPDLAETFPARVSAALEPAAAAEHVGGEEDGLAREQLTVRAESWARGSRSPATWAAYQARWARFADWCARAGECALPAAPLTLARFLADLAPIWRPATPHDPPEQITAGQVRQRPGLRPQTLTGYVAAISVAHQSAGVPNPARAEAVRTTLAGIRRHPGLAPPARRTAARTPDLVAILATLRPQESLADARDAALLLVGWKAALRASDLAGMRIEDQQLTEDGLAVHLRRSKTDQIGAGATIGITASHTTHATPPEDEDAEADAGDGGEAVGEGRWVSLDAVTAWAHWKALLGSHGVITGPAWRGIDRYGTRPRQAGLHRNSIRAILKARAADAGLDAEAWGSHSLRRGFATEALAAGAAERAVQHHGRWASRASLDPYIDDATTFDTTNPTRWLE